MSAVRILPPVQLPVDLALAKLNLRIDGDDMDLLVTSWVRGIVAKLEHEIGQCLVTQTWRVSVDGFHNGIALPHPALQVALVSYVDADGNAQRLAPAACRIHRTSYRSTLLPAAGASWPATLADLAAVTIEVVCGYGDQPEQVPDNLKLYILAKLVEEFDPVTRMERDTTQSAFVTGLLDACRTYA